MRNKLIALACLTAVGIAVPAIAQQQSCFSSTPDACQFGFYDNQYVINYFASQNGFQPIANEIGESPVYPTCVAACATAHDVRIAACLAIPDGEASGPQARNACITDAERRLNNCMANCPN